jgi:TonB-linked SusC/RagA family outer membrane protein
MIVLVPVQGQHTKLKAFSRYLLSFLTFCLVFVTQIYGQEKTVSGVVTDNVGKPLASVNIAVKDTDKGTNTNEDGRFVIALPEGKNILVFTFAGFSRQELMVPTTGMMQIMLQPEVNALSDVVVVGYGSQKRVSVTAAISNVKTDEILRSPVSSVANALAGRATGIITVQRGGEPGRDIADIFIRGVGTFAGGNSARPLVLVDGVERSLNGIDPYTIESFNILKDASATAVFGVRGANGVIIITTKTGATGKPQFSLSTNFAWQEPIRLPETLGAVEYARLRNTASQNDGSPPLFNDYDIERFQKQDDPYFHPDVNWLDYLLRDYSPQQQYNLNMSGGTNDARYFVSLGFLNQDGAYKLGNFFDEFSANPNFKRYNLRANFDFNLSKEWSVAIKAGSEISNSNYSRSNTSDIFGTIYSANPMMSPVLFEDKIVRNVDGLTALQISNTPLYQLLWNGFNQNFSSALNLNFATKYKLDKITKGLSARVMLAYDSYYLQSVLRRKQIPLWDLRRNPAATSFQDSIRPIAVVNQFEGPISFDGESFLKNRKVYGEAAIEYTNKFGLNNVGGMILGTLERRFDGTNQLPFNYMGLVGRATYNYDNKYMAEFNLGFNGSENFAVGNQFGVFPSFSLGYVVSEEKFFPQTEAVTFVKLRGSYGTVGNDKIGGNRFLFLPSSFQSGGNYFLGINHTSMPGYREATLGNPNVTWEKATKLNLGIDLKFWDNKITFAADYFREQRNDILWQLNIPITFGNPAIVAPYNIGQAENKGYEFELGFTNTTRNGNLRYWVNANYTFARNKIIYMDEVPQPFPGLAMTGSRIGQMKGLLADGIYNTMEEINDPNRPRSQWEGSGLRPGDIRYVDVNGDKIIDDNDRVNIGNPNIPEIIYGATFGLQWKFLEVSVFFQGAGNVSTYLQGEAAWPFIAGTKTAFANAEQSWSEERYKAGLPITLPRLTASPEAGKHNYRQSSFWMQDASYLRLKNLEIAANFSKAFLDKVGIKNLRVFINGQNLHTWTKMPYFDPEIPNSNGSIYPVMRVFNGGFNLQF